MKCSQYIQLFCTLLFIYAGVGQVTVSNPLNAPDLPNFTQDLNLVPAGSLIIPMDPTNQVLVPGTTQMSVLPYGLAIRTLHANISLWWAIATGKAFNGADFVGPTQTTTFSTIMGIPNPTVGSAGIWSTATTTTTYSGGPLIILAKDADKAFSAWYSWSQDPATYYPTVDPSVYNTVNIHMLTQDTTIDIRHKIYVRPVVGVSNLDGNAATQTAMMGCIYQDNPRQCPLENGYGWGGIFGNGAAGCLAYQPQDHAGLDWGVHYNTYDCGSSVSALTESTCLTTFSEPHWDWVASSGPQYISAMKSFILSGANFFAQCASIQSYENQAGNVGSGTFMSTYGIGSVDPDDGVDPPTTLTVYPDLPVSQFIGDMSSAITGQVPDFYNYFSYPNDNAPGSWVVPTTEPSAAGEINWDVSPPAFPIVTNIINSNSLGFDGRNLYVAAAAKYNNLVLGANVWYLGGHTWVGQSTPGTENGRRMFFNALLVPAARPASCGFTFCSATDTCPPQDACHTCACNSAGTGFVQTAIPNCCLNSTTCTTACTVCSTTSHTCVTDPTCCNVAAGINCSSSCQVCTSGVCQSKSGCCTNNTQCGTSPCDICQNAGTGNAACVTTPTPCCDPTQAGSCSSLGACQYCAANNTCTRNSTNCCLVNTDCGSSPCDKCNTQTNLCYTVPGCCNNNSQCGTNPCIICTNNSCVTNPSCCSSNAQCGTCQICNSSNLCQAEASTSCCTQNSDCGTCSRCATSSNGTKYCVAIADCCLPGISSATCEICQECNGTTNQCQDIPGCCGFDADCLGCEICTNFTCEAHPTLYCCADDNDCTVAQQEAQAQPNNNASSCPYYCDLTKGVCQADCHSGINYTGLIVGLAAGVPILLAAILAILAAIAFFIYLKKDYLNEKFFQKSGMSELGVINNPTHVPAVTVAHNTLT